MASYVTEAVVTGARRYGEADRLVTLISPDRGRFTAIAKSARKPKSSLRGVTEPFVRAKFELAEARTLDIIRQAEAIEIHLGIRDSWKRLQMAGHVAEIANRMSEERFPDHALYELLNNALDGISDGDESSVMRFKVGILEHMGIFPDLSGCSKCGVERVKGSVHLDTKGHGFLCNDCAKEMHIWQPYPMKVLRILHVYRNGDINEHAADAELMEAADELVTGLLQAFLQHGFKTSKGMKQIRASGIKKDKGRTVSDDIKSGPESG